MRRRIVLPFLALLFAALPACSGDEVSPASSPTLIPTPTATSTATPTPTEGSSPRPTPPRGTSTATGVPPTVIAFGQPVVMRPGDEVTIENGWLLRVIGVTNDSRCPVDVQCIWAGEATVQLAIIEAAASTPVGITMPGGSAAAATLGADTIEASALFPAPRSTTSIAPGDYEVTLVVRPIAVTATGIDGLVTVGPQCPIVRADQPCPDLPYEAGIVIRDTTGSEVARVRSGVDGRFAIDLPPRRYRIEPEAGQPLPSASPLDVEVRAGARAFVAIHYDSGIR